MPALRPKRARRAEISAPPPQSLPRPRRIVRLRINFQPWYPEEENPEYLALRERYIVTISDEDGDHIKLNVDVLGKDFASHNQRDREYAFGALYSLLPQLWDLNYERDKANPNKFTASGNLKSFMDRHDIVTYLYQKLVIDGSFMWTDKSGWNPLPYIRRAIHSWLQEETKQQHKYVSLATLNRGRDEIDTLERLVPVTAPIYFETRHYSQAQQEIVDWKLARPDWLPTFGVIGLHNRTVKEVAWYLRQEYTSFRQQLRTERRAAIQQRDALFSLLLSYLEGTWTAPFLRNVSDPQQLVAAMRRCFWFADQVDFVRPYPWSAQIIATACQYQDVVRKETVTCLCSERPQLSEGTMVIGVRHLTTQFNNSPAHLYQLTIHSEFHAHVLPLEPTSDRSCNLLKTVLVDLFKAGTPIFMWRATDLDAYTNDFPYLSQADLEPPGNHITYFISTASPASIIAPAYRATVAE
ncbi:MAG: hypothetical protein M3R24_33355 [Chloroflexota bacterium]|nr:hypothetical protein [Chloroflexota bacterium]